MSHPKTLEDNGEAAAVDAANAKAEVPLTGTDEGGVDEDGDGDEDEPVMEGEVEILTDENFERLTQASTGATTGDWFISE